jgi:hypothetical protein
MEAIVGNRYRTTNNGGIGQNYRDKWFIVQSIDHGDDGFIHVLFDGMTTHRTIRKRQWNEYVRKSEAETKWVGNILKFHFV